MVWLVGAGVVLLFLILVTLSGMGEELRRMNTPKPSIGVEQSGVAGLLAAILTELRYAKQQRERHHELTKNAHGPQR